MSIKRNTIRTYYGGGFIAFFLFLTAGLAHADWIRGETSMSRLPEAQKRAIIEREILIPPEFIEQYGKRPNRRVVDRSELPARFDWRNKDNADWLTPIRDQEDCGACWAFGTLAAVEAAMNIHLNNPDFDYDLSEQYLVSCAFGSCEIGGLAEEVLIILKDGVGVPDEACMPYGAYEGACSSACSDAEARSVNIADWGAIYQDNELQIKQQLLLAPVPTTMNVHWDFYDYSGGVYDSNMGEVCDLFNNPTNHIVTIVGWDDYNDSWIVRNSWGTDWGNDGYFEIKRGSSCLGTFSSYWLTIDPDTIPGYTPEVKVCVSPQNLTLTATEGMESYAGQFDVINCGGLGIRWNANADSRFRLVPDGGGLEVGGATGVEIYVDATGLTAGDTLSKQIGITTYPTGQDARLLVHVVVEPEGMPDGDEDGGEIADNTEDEPAIDGDIDTTDNNPPLPDGDDESNDDEEAGDPCLVLCETTECGFIDGCDCGGCADGLLCFENACIEEVEQPVCGGECEGERPFCYGEDFRWLCQCLGGEWAEIDCMAECAEQDKALLGCGIESETTLATCFCKEAAIDEPDDNGNPDLPPNAGSASDAASGCRKTSNAAFKVFMALALALLSIRTLRKRTHG